MRAIEETAPRARKPHRCDTCARVIEVGEQYYRQVALTDEGLVIVKSCAECEQAWSTFWWRWGRDFLCGEDITCTLEELLTDEAPDDPDAQALVRGIRSQWGRQTATPVVAS